jgi:hypothetical protein
MRGEPCPASVYSQFVERDDRSPVVPRRASRQVQLNLLEDLAASKCRARRTATQKNLVDVVVQDDAELMQVVFTEGPTDLLRERVADRVGMAGAFALDDFDRLVGRRRRIAGTDQQFQDIPPSDRRSSPVCVPADGADGQCGSRRASSAGISTGLLKY